MDGNGILICRFGSRRKKKKRIHPRCSVVAVFKMLIRILNTLPSRIWDVFFFLFSGYLNLQLVRMGVLSRKLWLSAKLNYPFYSVATVFKMFIRILNTLPSRTWDISFFLFSDSSLLYPKSRKNRIYYYRSFIIAVFIKSFIIINYFFCTLPAFHLIFDGIHYHFLLLPEYLPSKHLLVLLLYLNLSK